MFKYLFLLGLFYIAYRLFTQPSIDPPEEDQPEDEFVDYDEVE